MSAAVLRSAAGGWRGGGVGAKAAALRTQRRSPSQTIRDPDWKEREADDEDSTTIQRRIERWSDEVQSSERRVASARGEQSE